MNDRYLFKAKRIDNGEWVIGLLTKMWGQLHIINSDNENTAYPIDESTLCQCTGLRDKRGTLIWENDICFYDYRAKFVVKFGTYNEFTDKRHLGFYAKWEDKWDGLYREDFGYWSNKVKVIDSIFDNPELLEVE